MKQKCLHLMCDGMLTGKGAGARALARLETPVVDLGVVGISNGGGNSPSPRLAAGRIRWSWIPPLLLSDPSIHIDICCEYVKVGLSG